MMAAGRLEPVGFGAGRLVERCIGDAVATDAKGANDQGLDVLFVASGIHGAETIGPNGVDAAAVEALLAKDGARATYAISDLAW